MRATVAGILGGLVGMGLVLWSCTGPTETPTPPPADRIGSMAAYVYASDPQDYLTAPQSFPLAPEMAPAEALTALGSHLSRTYFGGDPDTETLPIRFEVLRVHRFPVAQRFYRLAVINMIDPELRRCRVFFKDRPAARPLFTCSPRPFYSRTKIRRWRMA
jgi:hypothetical protein